MKMRTALYGPLENEPDMPLIAAMPMYDWPEIRDETDARWAGIRDMLRGKGIAAPDRLTRRNGDMPPVPGGIRDADGEMIAPDPASLPPDDFHLGVLWRHPALVFAETCWGPMEHGLQRHVSVIGQSDYTGIPGGDGALYSSAIIARKGFAASMAPPVSGQASLPLGLLEGQRLAFNERHSLSGLLALERDLEALGRTMALFGETVATGSHRASIRAVAKGEADIAAVDAKTWQLAQRFEPAAQAVHAVGWTARRKGLPFIRSRCLSPPSDTPSCEGL